VKTYTGPTVGGGRMTVTCPDWCVTDHAYWDDTADDMFHASAPAELLPPRDRGGYIGGRANWPLLSAELRTHSTDHRPAGACVWLAPDECTDHGIELDLAGLDALLGQVDAFRAQLAEQREVLASLDVERRALVGGAR
jgi:hypothetical protein